MNVLFRVDGNSTMGTGHIMRCLALAQAFDRAGLNVTFAVNADGADICRSRHDWVGRIEIVPDNLDNEHQFHWLRKLKQSVDASLCVIDGYHFDEGLRKLIHSLDWKVISFDDCQQEHPLHTDMVINGADNIDPAFYREIAGGAVLCLGNQYRIFRREFIDQVVLPFEQKLSFTITMGGSDPLDITIPTLKALEQRQFNAAVRVITGAAYPRLSTLREFLRHTTLTVQHIHNCQDVADIFSHSRLTFSAAGSSQFELLTCGSPSLLAVVADNQWPASSHAAEQGWCRVIDLRGGKRDFNEIAKSIEQLWQQQETLQQMSDAAYRLRDVDGATRVMTKIRDLFQREKE